MNMKVNNFQVFPKQFKLSDRNNLSFWRLDMIRLLYFIFSDLSNDINYGGALNEVHLVMNNPKGCHKFPEKDMDEHCKLIYIAIFASL